MLETTKKAAKNSQKIGEIMAKVTSPRPLNNTSALVSDTNIVPENKEEENVLAFDTISEPNKLEPVPAREIDKMVAENRAKRALPKVPGKMVDFQALVDWLAPLTEDMWRHIMIYVYRHTPVIDKLRGKPDGVKYIDVISEPPFNLQYMIEKHGGGKYGFSICDTDLRKFSQIFDAKLSLPIAQYEPKINLEELVIEDRDNIPYVARLKAEGRLDKDGKPVDMNNRQSIGGNGNSGNVDSNAVLGLAKEFINMFQKMNADQQANIRSKLVESEGESLSKSMGNILIEKMKQEDPAKFVTMITGLLTAMKSQTADTSTQSNLLDRVVNMQAEHTKTMFEMMKMQIESLRESKQAQEPEEKKSEIEKLKELLELVKLVKGGGSTSSPREWPDIALDFAKELGVPLLTTINNLFSLKKGGAQAPLQTTPPIQMPTAIPQGVATGVADINSNMNPGNISNQNLNQLLPIINQFGGMIITKIQNGVKGWEFAEDLVRFYGPAPHAMVSKFGVDGVLSTFKQLPEFWQQLEPIWGEAYLKTWVEEFIGYEEILASMEKEEAEMDKEVEETLAEDAAATTVVPGIVDLKSVPITKKGRRS